MRICLGPAVPLIISPCFPLPPSVCVAVFEYFHCTGSTYWFGQNGACSVQYANKSKHLCTTCSTSLVFAAHLPHLPSLHIWLPSTHQLNSRSTAVLPPLIARSLFSTVLLSLQPHCSPVSLPASLPAYLTCQTKLIFSQPCSAQLCHPPSPLYLLPCLPPSFPFFPTINPCYIT